MRAQRKSLEAHYRLDVAFDGSMVLLDNVVRILDLSDLDERLPFSVHGLGVAKLAPPLSTVKVRGEPFRSMASSKERRNSTLSQCA
jgi:hypothetical protein